MFITPNLVQVLSNFVVISYSKKTNVVRKS